MTEEESAKNRGKLEEMRNRGMKVGSLVEIAFSEGDLHFDDMPSGGHFVHHYSSDRELKSPNVVYAGYVIDIEHRTDEVFGLVNSFDRTKMTPSRLNGGIKVYGNAVQKYRIISE